MKPCLLSPTDNCITDHWSLLFILDYFSVTHVFVNTYAYIHTHRDKFIKNENIYSTEKKIVWKL